MPRSRREEEKEEEEERVDTKTYIHQPFVHAFRIYDININTVFVNPALLLIKTLYFI